MLQLVQYFKNTVCSVAIFILNYSIDYFAQPLKNCFSISMMTPNHLLYLQYIYHFCDSINHQQLILQWIFLSFSLTFFQHFCTGGKGKRRQKYYDLKFS